MVVRLLFSCVVLIPLIVRVCGCARQYMPPLGSVGVASLWQHYLNDKSLGTLALGNTNRKIEGSKPFGAMKAHGDGACLLFLWIIVQVHPLDMPLVCLTPNPNPWCSVPSRETSGAIFTVYSIGMTQLSIKHLLPNLRVDTLTTRPLSWLKTSHVVSHQIY